RSQDCGFGYFVGSLVDALADGREFVVWEADDINMVATPSLASECGELIHRIGELGDVGGIFHLCGADAMSRMELAELACEVFELDRALLRSGPADPDSMPGSPIPYDTSLAVRRTAEILGNEPLSARELLTRFRSEEQSRQLVDSGSTQ
ncbi:MAG: hypothetical protein ACR2PK_08285, partial [Acidimicrobiales bacterium]